MIIVEKSKIDSILTETKESIKKVIQEANRKIGHPNSIFIVISSSENHISDNFNLKILSEVDDVDIV